MPPTMGPWAPSSSATDDDAGRGLERADQRALLDQALGTLSDVQRQTFVLYADAELSYREVAGALGSRSAR